MPETQKKIDKAHKDIVRAFVAITVLFCLVALFFGYFVRQNTQRIHDVQASRIASCQRTYIGIKEVFQPFLPEKPKTEQQAEQIRKFNERITILVAQCEHQTSPANDTKPKSTTTTSTTTTTTTTADAEEFKP